MPKYGSLISSFMQKLGIAHHLSVWLQENIDLVGLFDFGWMSFDV